MLLYLSLIVVVMSAVMLAETCPQGTAWRRMLYGAAFLAMVLFAGARNLSVGTDTENYAQFFSSITDLPSALGMGLVDNEYGFWILNWLAHLLLDDYAALLTVIAVIVVAGYVTAIMRLSCHRTISIFIFLTAGFYTFFFNGARQAIACAICALALPHLLDKDFKKYFGLVLFAVLFHKTAIIMVPVYFITAKSISFGRLCAYVAFGSIAAMFLETVVAFGASIDPRYADYAVQGEGGGFVMVAFSLILTIFFFGFRRFVILHRAEYLLLLNMILIGSIISLISTIFRIAPSGILRLSVYFNVATLFLWPIVFANIRPAMVRSMGLYLLGFGYIGFFLLSIDRFGDLTPYVINPLLALNLF